jgi:hypothetical protein
MRTRLTVALVLALALLLPSVGQAATTQPDIPSPWNTAWNTAGMAVPLAVDPATSAEIHCCGSPLLGLRSPETDEDAQVAAADWWLSGGYLGGWGVTVVFGASSAGGMGQPAGNQAFVFVDDVFAGTMAPFGTGPDEGPPDVRLLSPNSLSATFHFFAAGDLFCCPSIVIDVLYSIDDSSGMPVLVVQSAANSTQAN